MSGGKTNKTETQNSSAYYDNRSVVDAGGGIVGNGNSWDQSQTFVDATQQLTSNTDNSMRFDDRSDRRVDNSMQFDDRSDRRVNISTSDGAFDVVERMAAQVGKMGQAQTDAARDIALKAGGQSDDALKFARQAQEDAAGFNNRVADRSFDLAGQSQKFAQTASDSALAFSRGTYDRVMEMAQTVVTQAGRNASEAAGVAKGAYDSAASTASGNKTLIYVAIGAVVLVGGLVALKA
nr:hypothetical protein [uncultured Roseateles sp.]